jgi:hypothetical protein
MTALPRLQLRLMDNNGGVSRPGYYLPEGTPPAAALSWANTLRSVLLPLTNAALQDALLSYDLGITPSGPADLTSNSRDKLALFYSTEAISAHLVIPSPRQLAYDLDGPWRGFRLTRDSAAAAGLLVGIEEIVAGTVFSDNTPFPTTFVVGSLEQIVQ